MYLEYRKHLGQAAAAARAGLSVRTGRRVEQQGGPAMKGRERDWRTREDPFEKVWDNEVVPLLQAKMKKSERLHATTLLGHLRELHPGQFGEGLLRTLQRRVNEWRLRHGPTPELIFRQQEEPGRMGLSDFTVADGLGVTIAGEPLPHRFYQFRLAYSGWCWVRVVVGGETFAALSAGLIAAITALGGSPLWHRTDSLSAAFRNLGPDQAEDQTRAYQQLCRDLGMRPCRNNPGRSHENGAIESPQGHLKDRLDQALQLRGDRDFAGRPAYEAFVEDQVTVIRSRLDPTRLAADRAALRPWPQHQPPPTPSGREHFVRVSTGATITVSRVVYSVDPRLKGQQVRAVALDDRVEVYHRGELRDTLPRLDPGYNRMRQKYINYHHVIQGLIRKPGALARYIHRDALHPSPTYRAIYAMLSAQLDERAASKTYLGLLYLAHQANCEKDLEQILADCLETKTLPDLPTLQQRFQPALREPQFPPIIIAIPPPSTYDQLCTIAWSQQQGEPSCTQTPPKPSCPASCAASGSQP